MDIFEGQKIGKWIIIKKGEKGCGGSARWLCRCECGTKKLLYQAALKRGDTLSCGCFIRYEQLEGQTFGRLKVLKKVENKYKYRRTVWKCLCECGNITNVTSLHLKNGHTKSCGCYREEMRIIANLIEPGQAAFNDFYRNYRHSAKDKNQLFELSEEQFKKIIKQNCFYCGEPASERKWGCHTNGGYVMNGIDRFDNNVGYTMKNCRPCCTFCNMMKGDTSGIEFLNWINKLKQFNQN